MGVGGIRVVNVAILFIIRGSRLREFAGSEEHLRLDKLQVTSDIQDHDHTSAFFSYGCICRCCPLESGLLGHLEWYVEGSCAFASWFQLLLPDATFGTPDVSSPQQLLMLFATSNSPCFRPLELIYIVEKIGLALIRVGARVTGQVFKNESRSLTSIMLNLLFTIYCTCGTGMASSAVNFSYERKHSGRPHKSRASSYRGRRL